MLTLQQLKDMKPDTIFANGETIIANPWFGQSPNVGDKEVKVKWVAIRGYIHDWAIYHSFDSNLMDDWRKVDDSHLHSSDRRITQMGAKLHDINKVQELVPCDQEALLMYRH